jgi:ribosomal protein S18 acetylase RimI-like enzyme
MAAAHACDIKYLCVCAADVDEDMRRQVLKLEQDNMNFQYARNGDPLHMLLERRNLILRMALDPDEKLLGFALHTSEDEPEDGHCVLYELHVHPDARRRGIGSTLLALAKQEGRETELEVHEDNFAAFCFYLKRGFQHYRKFWMEEIRTGGLQKYGIRIMRTGITYDD